MCNVAHVNVMRVKYLSLYSHGEQNNCGYFCDYIDVYLYHIQVVLLYLLCNLYGIDDLLLSSACLIQYSYPRRYIYVFVTGLLVSHLLDPITISRTLYRVERYIAYIVRRSLHHLIDKEKHIVHRNKVQKPQPSTCQRRSRYIPALRVPHRPEKTVSLGNQKAAKECSCRR
jgi:hypothetical protein